MRFCEEISHKQFFGLESDIYHIDVDIITLISPNNNIYHVIGRAFREG
ncbi:hypothetical protein A0J51_00222 [Gluconobacter japonicus]|nr:hypothetical protein A0J51_00222 [Gluconobacter japonicus]